MNPVAWRIAAEAPSHCADDMTGAGAMRTGGRWNSPGTAIVYCASSIALSVLESLVDFKYGRLPYNRYLVRVEIPKRLWAARECLAPPAGWDAIPIGRSSRNAGDGWVTSMRSPLLLVPSVVVPEEFNILINPLHPATAAITATTLRRWHYDPRLY